MDPSIASRFNETILRAGMRRFETDPDSAEVLDGFESFIYRFERPDGRFVLRVGHSSRRSPDLIQGEVDWIDHLAQGGAGVARAIRSREGHLVEQVEDGQGGSFLFTAFVHAPGGPPHSGQINELLFQNYGRLIGRIHRLSQTYVPADPAWRRPEWDSPLNCTGERQMPAQESQALSRYRVVLSSLKALPRDPQSYGLIHQDAHPGNFFVADDGSLTLFDFDDCVYGHFIYDIAMVLFYTSTNERDPVEFTARFMPVFLSAYREENRLDPRWLDALPLFMKLREIELFAAILFSFPDGGYTAHPWTARYMNGRRERILSDAPFIQFDWASLAGYLS